MKKFKLLSAIAMAGLLGLSARAAFPSDLETVSIKLTILTQTNNTTSGSTTKFHVTKLKVVNKDVLHVISEEFTNIPALTNKNNQLAVSEFFSGTFEVLDKDGNVILDDASSSTNGDDYDLSFDYDNYVYTGSDDSKEVLDYTTVAFFDYNSSDDSSSFELDGVATVKETYADKDSESFKFTGAGDGFFDGNDAVVTGTASGSGKDNL